jgi:hypothetical protein
MTVLLPLSKQAIYRERSQARSATTAFPAGPGAAAGDGPPQGFSIQMSNSHANDFIFRHGRA